MTSINRSALVPYSAHRMFALVADVPSYSEFLPWCSGARVVSTQGDEIIAAVDIAYSGVHKTFSTRNLMQSDKIIEMRLLEGPFKYLQGLWRFDALDDEACKISLDLEFEVANRVVGVVLTPVFTKIANQLVDSFHQRAVALYGKPA